MPCPLARADRRKADASVTRARLLVTVAAFALDGALGLVLMDILRTIAWPGIAGLLRYYQLVP